jgi:O-antigen/teichoic acid export membrane protein
LDTEDAPRTIKSDSLTSEPTLAGSSSHGDEEEKGEGSSLFSRKRVLRSSLYEFGGYGTQQVLRLLSNVILARLLFPAAFGLASTVNVILFGLLMLSDMGIQQFIIQSPRGEEQKYLDTAFTFQAIRGVILALAMVALSFPAAWFFKEPQLAPLICIGAIQLVATGLHSTSLFSFRRRLTIGWNTILELGSTVLNLGIMIPWAIVKPSVLPLVVGGAVSACVYAFATHLLPVGYKNRFHWDKDAYREMSHFGRWIFGSSAVTFFGGQIDRFFYGRFIGMTWLGIYSIALNLSEAVSSLLNRLISGIVYPLLSQASRDSNSDISSAYYRVRLRMDAFAMAGTGLLAGAGGWIIKALWDDRYADAAWILRLLCIKVALYCIIGQGENCLTSMGHSRYGFWRSVCRLISVAVGLPVGWYAGGVIGVLWASVLSELPAVFFIWPKLSRLKILRLHREALSVVMFLAAFFVGLAILQLLPEIRLHRS